MTRGFDAYQWDVLRSRHEAEMAAIRAVADVQTRMQKSLVDLQHAMGNHFQVVGTNLAILRQGQEETMAALDQARAEVAALRQTVVDLAREVAQSAARIVALLEQAQGAPTPEEVAALTGEIRTEREKLAEFVAALDPVSGQLDLPSEPPPQG